MKILKMVIDSFIDNLMSNIVSLVLQLTAMAFLVWYTTSKIDRFEAQMVKEYKATKEEVVQKLDGLTQKVEKFTGKAIVNLKKDKDEIKKGLLGALKKGLIP